MRFYSANIRTTARSFACCSMLYMLFDSPCHTSRHHLLCVWCIGFSISAFKIHNVIGELVSPLPPSINSRAWSHRRRYIAFVILSLSLALALYRHLFASTVYIFFSYDCVQFGLLLGSPLFKFIFMLLLILLPFFVRCCCFYFQTQCFLWLMHALKLCTSTYQPLQAPYIHELWKRTEATNERERMQCVSVCNSATVIMMYTVLCLILLKKILFLRFSLFCFCLFFFSPPRSNRNTQRKT